MTWPAVRPRDFLETGDGLFFAVVSPLQDDGRYLASLRYHRHQGRLQKLATDAAAALLESAHPGWRAHSSLTDAVVHLVPAGHVVRVHRPGERLARLLQCTAEGAPLDVVSSLAVEAVRALEARGAPVGRLGLSGSLLLDAAGPASDIDLVASGRQAFAQARQALAQAIADGALGPLTEAHWRTAWERRGSELTFDQYLWHERRKGTKALVRDTRIDLSLVPDAAEARPLPLGARKLARGHIVATVTGADAAFDHPACYEVAHPDVVEVLSFTPTYAGQAVAGEQIEAAGWIEADATGIRRLVVGTGREAVGEWIRVSRPS